VFTDPYALSRYDEGHSDIEDRWVLLGKAMNETLLIVVHTYKTQQGVELVRVISARKATKNEMKAYQQRCSK